MLDGNPVVSLLWMIVSIAVIIGLAYWFTRYVAGRGAWGAFAPMKVGAGLELLAQLPLGREQKLIVAQVGERFFLLGVTASEISMLAELRQRRPPFGGSGLRRQKRERRPAFARR